MAENVLEREWRQNRCIFAQNPSEVPHFGGGVGLLPLDGGQYTQRLNR